jgi:hypothetical protein
MAQSLDVDGRLAEGEPALIDFDTYLAACAALGYQYCGPELRQLYDAEYGLDLRALDSDCRSLAAAADAAEDVLLLQNNISRSGVAAWSGAGGVSAGDFLGRQSGSAQSVVSGLRRAADALAGLRDELSRAVDAKVAAVLAAADQASGHRGVWTAAAHAVIGGGGDQAVASEIVDQQVKPFVDTVLCGEVLPALARSSDAVAAAYDSALTSVTEPSVAFELPGDFGAPVPAAPVGWGAPPAMGSAAASVVPGSWVAPQPISSDGGVPIAESPPMSPAAAAPVATLPAAADPPVADAARPLGGPAPALPADIGLGSAAGGFGRQLADALGGVLGSAAGLSPDVAGLGDLTDGLDDGVDVSDAGDAADDDLDADDEGESDSDDSEGDDSDEEDEDATDAPDVEGGGAEQSAAPTDDDAAQQPPAATPPPVPVEGPAQVPAEPVAAESATSKTPCQIAADELPQVGE